MLLIGYSLNCRCLGVRTPFQQTGIWLCHWKKFHYKSNINFFRHVFTHTCLIQVMDKNNRFCKSKMIMLFPKQVICSFHFVMGFSIFHMTKISFYYKMLFLQYARNIPKPRGCSSEDYDPDSPRSPSSHFDNFPDVGLHTKRQTMSKFLVYILKYKLSYSIIADSINPRKGWQLYRSRACHLFPKIDITQCFRNKGKRKKIKEHKTLVCLLTAPFSTSFHACYVTA